jgi:hypothetical protein
MGEVRNGGGEVSSFRAVNHPKADHADLATPSSRKGSVASADAPPLSKSTGKSSTRTSTPAAGATQPSANTPGASDQPPQSQPMTATTSASSHASAKDVKEPAAAPYGTRSRNRPGTSRINYAEDSVEMDFEMSAATANGNTSDAASRASAVTERRPSPTATGRKGNGVGQASWGNNVPNSKEAASNLNIPGTSTFSANPNANSAQPPKRRKNAAAHSSNAAHANSGAPSQAHARRANNAMIAANSSRETNMMTFDRTGAVLKNAKLEADDGRTVSINGKWACQHHMSRDTTILYFNAYSMILTAL